MNQWRVEVEYVDGTKKIIKVRNKFEAKMKIDHYMRMPDVKYADAFDGEDYIDYGEL